MANPSEIMSPRSGSAYDSAGNVVWEKDMHDELIDALKYSIEANVDTGKASADTNTTTLTDATKDWPANMWNNAILEIERAGVHYLRRVISHTATTLTFAAIASAVEEDDNYWLKIPITITAIDQSTNGETNKVQVGGRKTEDFESITVADTAVALTTLTVGTNTSAIITVENYPIRIRADGVDPTAAVGHLMQPHEVILLESAEELAAFRAIRSTADSAVIRVSYKAVA